MKKILFSTLALIFCIHTFGQNDQIKLRSMSIHYVAYDFETAAEIRSKGLSTVIKEDQAFNSSRITHGMAIGYMKGVSKRIDFAATLSAALLEYPVPNKTSNGNRYGLLEATAMAHVKMVSDKYCINPFLNAGVGASKYKGYFSAFIPVGIGVQIKLLPEIFLQLNSQYRIPVTEFAAYHFYNSLGIIAPIEDRKVEAPPVVVVIPVVVDRDGDGVLDVDDKCPDTPGIAALLGCPDRDADGIADNDDKCPDEAGLAKYTGCPIPDSDSDGINDEQDKCPTEKGFARYQGCPIPDTDGDGVNDEEDKCPKRVGPADNFGCPVIGIKSYEIVFKTGSAVLLPAGKSILDTVVTYLNNNPDVTVTVDGHTDNTGSDKVNLPLSKKRAEATKTYIASKGIDPARMITAGYGSTQPVADNKTAAGRAKNRRIEIKIKQ